VSTAQAKHGRSADAGRPARAYHESDSTGICWQVVKANHTRSRQVRAALAGSSHNEGLSSSPLLKQGAFFALMSERLFGNFKISKTIATALVTVHPGGVRELHWHPNANEWQ
jgi:hypothetical protein